MSELKKIKEQFRDFLPYGFVSIIREKLKADYGRDLSRGKISQVCNPEHKDWDDDVITIALNIAAEKQKRQRAIKIKAEAL